MFAQASVAQVTREFAADVRHYLTKTGQRELHSKYLYDDIGTALFEVITLLPEYGLTRADDRILREYAAEIVGETRGAAMVAELGSGSGRKARWILEALAARGRARYYPIDVSAAALYACRNELGKIDNLQIDEIQGSYTEGLRQVVARRSPHESLLVLFLGSTIGNFERGPAGYFLRQVRDLLSPGDALLLGADLVKPAPQLLAAYDDSIGVTAAFNLNLLARINRELDGDFDLARFRHLARYNEAERRVEMHLESLEAQKVNIARAGLSIDLAAGETIWTESSHKYTPPEIEAMALKAGFVCERQWIDREWPFAESLLRVRA